MGREHRAPPHHTALEAHRSHAGTNEDGLRRRAVNCDAREEQRRDRGDYGDALRRRLQ